MATADPNRVQSAFVLGSTSEVAQAICRELAHMLGAGVGLHSVAGKGSTFWVEVPVQFAARALQPLMSGRAD